MKSAQGENSPADGTVAAVIRAAQPLDTPIILEFIRELADYERLLPEVEATEDALRQALFGPAPSVFCDIAQWREAPVGFALWFKNFSTFGGRHGIYLEDLFVREPYRGRGIGKALLANLARRCVANGWSRLQWSVLDWNAPSIAFYKRQGAVLMEDWKTCRVSGAALAKLAGGA